MNKKRHIMKYKSGVKIFVFEEEKMTEKSLENALISAFSRPIIALVLWRNMAKYGILFLTKIKGKILWLNRMNS